MKRRIFFSGLCSAITFLISYAVICPYVKTLGDGGVVSVLPISFKRYLLTALITAAVFATAFLSDIYFKTAESFFGFIKARAKRTLLFLSGVVCIITASALVETVFRFFYGPDSAGKTFNTASFAAVAAIGLCIYIFVFERKKLASKPESAVALIILAAGCLIIFTEPFSYNSSDENSHYDWAVQNSFLGTAHLTEADYCVANNIGFSINDGHNIAASNEKVEKMNAAGRYSTYAVDVDNSLPHKAAGILIAIARLFGANFRTRFIFGQFGMLTVYATVVYFAIKKLKSGKMIMSVIALLPTNIVLAANYSYDPWVTGFSMLGTAYFVSETQQPEKPISVTETVIMCGAFVLAALPKQLYVVLLVLPMFICKKWSCKAEKRRYYLILFAFFVFMLTLFFIRAFSSVASGGDTRGGDVNSVEQFKYILTNPFKYSKTLIKFLLEYLSPLNLKKQLSFFSYLGDGGSAAVFILLLLFCMITDKDQTNRFAKKGLTAFAVTAVDFVIICMMATALYISFTPLKYETVFGCHQRYLMPLAAPFALTIINPGKPLKIKKSVYNTMITGVMTFCTVFKILYYVTYPML